MGESLTDKYYITFVHIGGLIIKKTKKIILGVFIHVGALGFQDQTTLWVNIISRVNKKGQEDEGVKLMVKLLYSLSRYHQGI